MAYAAIISAAIELERRLNLIIDGGVTTLDIDFENLTQHEWWNIVWLEAYTIAADYGIDADSLVKTRTALITFLKDRDHDSWTLG